jgi:hypothetical protein
MGSATFWAIFFLDSSGHPVYDSTPGSLSRTMVQESTGGKTMLATTVSVVMLLFIVLFIGPLFYHLPRVTIFMYLHTSLSMRSYKDL